MSDWKAWGTRLITRSLRTGAILLAASSAVAACTSGDTADPASPLPAQTPEGVPPPADLGASPAQDPPHATGVTKVQLNVGDSVLHASIVDSQASRDFLAQLPLTLTLKDYAGTEKVSDLASPLSTTDSPAGVDPAVGDITYYAPWGNLAIFYRDFRYSDGLVRLGGLDSGIEELASQNDDFTVRISLAP